MMKLSVSINYLNYPNLAPRSKNTLTDLTFVQGSGTQTVLAADDFSGSGLTFSLLAGESLASIDPQSGLIAIRTDDAVSETQIIAQATNPHGSAKSAFIVTVLGKSGIGYWKIGNEFTVS
ncbi:hypothetical protein [Rhodobacteraceae bacterium DSL-40]|uniref:hypothetical protein n=1 Tax=Amaricoccus sp. B4 TaxID=3368557 RepID=UPI000DABD6FF